MKRVQINDFPKAVKLNQELSRPPDSKYLQKCWASDTKRFFFPTSQIKMKHCPFSVLTVHRINTSHGSLYHQAAFTPPIKVNTQRTKPLHPEHLDCVCWCGFLFVCVTSVNSTFSLHFPPFLQLHPSKRLVRSSWPNLHVSKHNL